MNYKFHEKRETMLIILNCRQIKEANKFLSDSDNRKGELYTTRWLVELNQDYLVVLLTFCLFICTNAWVAS